MSDSYITTIYRKDYLWPELKPFFPRTGVTCRYALPIDPKTSAPIQTSTPMKKSECLHDMTWKKREPSEVEDHRRDVRQDGGNKVRLGTCPNTQALEFPKSETEACLKKLLQDNPNLFRVIKKLPLDDAIKRFNMERLRSTYQTDFGLADPPLTITLPKKPEPCPLDDHQPEQPDCKPSLHARAALLRLRHKEMNELLNTPCCPKCELNRLARLYKERHKPAQFELKVEHPWSTEYHDSINKPANVITKMYAKEKMKRRKKNRGKGVVEDCREKLTFG